MQFPDLIMGEKKDEPKSDELVQGEDYYFDENGLMVMTRAYHLKRGSCCENGCLNCPFTFRSEDGP